MLNLQPFNVPGLLIAADLACIRRSRGCADVLRRLRRSIARGDRDLASIANRTWPSIDMGKLDSAAQMLSVPMNLPGYPETSRNRAGVGPVHPISEARAGAAPTVSSQPMTEETLAPASWAPVMFSPVPAALLLPRATGTERLMKNMHTGCRVT